MMLLGEKLFVWTGDRWIVAWVQIEHGDRPYVLALGASAGFYVAHCKDPDAPKRDEYLDEEEYRNA